MSYTKFLQLSYGAIALTLMGCWSPKKAKKIYAEQKLEAPFDALIVPGLPYNGSSWDSLMMARVFWAKYLYDQKLATNIIFSGSAVYTPYFEGSIMREYAIALGLPAEHMFAENQAEHSVENVYYSVLMGKKMGFKRFALATDPYQNYFMKSVFKRKIDFLYYLPFEYDIMKTLEMFEPDIDNSSCKQEDFVALPDRESTIKRWRGTTGRIVDFDKMLE